MTTITDNQLAVLRAAALNCKLIAWPIPPRLKLSKGSATLVVKALMKKGVVEERTALEKDPSGGSRRMAASSPSSSPWQDYLPPVSEEQWGVRRVAKAIHGQVWAKLGRMQLTSSGMGPEKATGCSGGRGSISGATQPPKMSKAGTKLAVLVALLTREEVPRLAAATGWQAHTVRGVMSGALVPRGRPRVLRTGERPVPGARMVA